MADTATSKRIFITGGASGLGRALAARYRQAGWRVAIGDVNDLSRAETARALSVESFHCDVRRSEDLEEIARMLTERWGGVDVVVNNAGIASAGPIEEIPLAEWARVVDINLMGVVRGCRAFVPLMKRQHSGTLVNIASMAGLMNAPMMSPYNTTKAGVIALSETLRHELAGAGISVSVVCPSFFRTNLASSLAEGTPERLRKLTEGLVTRNKISADTIADRVFHAVARGELLVLTHRETQVAWMAKRLAPWGIFERMLASSTKRFRGA